MNIPSWALEIGFLGIGTVVFFGFRYLLDLIGKNTASDDKAREQLRSEMVALKAELHSRVSNTEIKLLAAIDKIPTSLVSTALCDGKQESWGIRFDNLVRSIEVASETRMKSDVVAHTALGDTLLEVVTEVKQLKECVTKLANKKEC